MSFEPVDKPPKKYLEARNIPVLFAPSYLYLHRDTWVYPDPTLGLEFDSTGGDVVWRAESILANSVEISSSTSLSNKYITERRPGQGTSAKRSAEGKIQLNYYLTGVDPLKRYYFDQETEALRGTHGDASVMKNLKLGGEGYHPNMIFKIGENVIRSGYLSSYSMTAKPNQPISVNASISFFHGLDIVSPNSVNPFPEHYWITSNPDQIRYLSYDDVTIETTSPHPISIDNILSLSYSFESTITPSIEIGQLFPNEIRYGEKKISMDIKTHATGIHLAHSGEAANLRMKTHHPDPDHDHTVGIAQGNLKDYYDLFEVDGVITSKKIDIQAHGEAEGSITLSQDTVGEAPSLSYWANTGSQSAVYPGEYFHIWGKNLENITDIEIQGRNAEISGVHTSDHIFYVKVPDDSFGAQKIIAYSIGGTSNILNFYITPRPIS
jgi:hypothetical protein